MVRDHRTQKILVIDTGLVSRESDQYNEQNNTYTDQDVSVHCGLVHHAHKISSMTIIAAVILPAIYAMLMLG